MAMKFIDMTGKTEDEAIKKALAQLGLDRDDVSVEILERAKSGFFGIGASPAKSCRGGNMLLDHHLHCSRQLRVLQEPFGSAPGKVAAVGRQIGIAGDCECYV